MKYILPKRSYVHVYIGKVYYGQYRTSRNHHIIYLLDSTYTNYKISRVYQWGIYFDLYFDIKDMKIEKI